MSAVFWGWVAFGAVVGNKMVDREMSLSDRMGIQHTANNAEKKKK